VGFNKVGSPTSSTAGLPLLGPPPLHVAENEENHLSPTNLHPHFASRAVVAEVVADELVLAPEDLMLY